MAPESVRKKVMVWVRARASGEERYLVLKTCSERGNFWQPVTGSVERDEAVQAAAEREFQEETGLNSSAPLRPVSTPFEFLSRGHRFKEYPFLAEVDSTEQKKVELDPREHDEFKWVSGSEALKMLKHESNISVLRDILNETERK